MLLTSLIYNYKTLATDSSNLENKHYAIINVDRISKSN